MFNGTIDLVQPPQFVHSQPRTKRCATHQYIARNIYLHQQVSKMNQFWPAAAGSASLCGVKPNNISTMTSTGNMIVSTQSQGNVSGLNLNVLQDKGKPATNSGKDKSSEAHSEQKNQLVLQQIQQPAVAGNSLVCCITYSTVFAIFCCILTSPFNLQVV